MKVHLKSKYNSYENHLQFLSSSKPTNRIFINIHGAFGESGDPGSKSEVLGELISSLGIANSVYVSTARNWDLYKKFPKIKKSEAFPEKVFLDEVNDIEDSLCYIIEQNPWNISDCEFFIVANSLGGTAISAIVEKFPQIQRLVLCNSGSMSVSKDHTIFTSLTDLSTLNISASKYKRKLLFIQGDMDDVVPKSFQDELFEFYKNAEKYKLEIPGANHNFSSLYGKDKELANNAYVSAIIRYFS